MMNPLKIFYQIPQNIVKYNNTDNLFATIEVKRFLTLLSGAEEMPQARRPYSM